MIARDICVYHEFCTTWVEYLILKLHSNVIIHLAVQWPVTRLTVYPKKYAHGFVVLCFVVVMQSFIMNSHEVFIHIHQGCFAGTGAIVRLPQCQWSKPDGYGKISQCITTTKHSKAKTVCIFFGIYCTYSCVWILKGDLLLIRNTWQTHEYRTTMLICGTRVYIPLLLLCLWQNAHGKYVRQQKRKLQSQ